MRTQLFVLPALCLGGAALLLAPARSSQAFSKLGGNLAAGQRDLRVHDNFADPTANDNTTPSPQFPVWLGAELAIWKAATEWASQSHSDGSGDPTQPVLGSGGANFDAFWAGAATSWGNKNGNIVSTISTCSGGVLAYTETPISDGWRIRFCESSWVWNDGPGTIPAGQFDIQGIMVHEYGHAIGLGHSSVNGTTMFPSVGSGVTSIRSIEADDIAGVKCVYGVKSVVKPAIVATVGNSGAGTLTIHGSNFHATNNEVWLCSNVPTIPSVNPRVKLTGIASTGGTVITISVPSNAGPGDVMVKLPTSNGGSSLSNAFPTDLVGTFGIVPLTAGPVLTSLSPPAVAALVPGTGRTVELAGAELQRVVSVQLDAEPVDPSRWRVLDGTRIEIDLPQLASLGAHVLCVSDGTAASALDFEVVAPAAPVLELATGEPLSRVQRDDGLTLRLSGQPGSRQLLLVSSASLPSQNALVSLEIGAGFGELVSAGIHTIPAQGWLELSISSLPDPGVAGQALYAQSVALGARPFAVSNLQSVFLVR